MCFALLSSAQTVFINELHYDNTGTDENEGLEIAGPAGTDLTCYQIHLYNGNNGSFYEPVVQLEGSLEDQNNGFGTLWVAIEGIQNGDNDAIALYNSCTEAVELFIGYEGTMAAVDGVAKDMISVDIGVAEIDTEASTSLQLIGSGMVYTDFIWAEAAPSSNGSINPNQTFGETSAAPTFNITPTELSIAENADSAVFTLQATNLEAMYTVNIIAKDGATATEIDDYTLSNNTYMVDGTSSTNQTIDIVVYLTNDDVEEEMENVEFEITVEGENATITNGAFILIIEDDDAPPPPAPTFNAYTIAEVHSENENGIADSLDVKCELSGLVYGTNLRDNGLLFTINDDSGGISIFSSSNNFGYEVKAGDELKVQGSIGQFNGLTQIVADSLWKVSEDNTLSEPSEFMDTGLYEALESEYIKMNAMTIIDPAEWKGDGSSFNVRFAASTITIDVAAPDTVLIRIDDNTSLASLSLEEVTGVAENYEMLGWSVTGIGGQFDNSEPYTSGYQLFPFEVSDIVVNEVKPSAPVYSMNNEINVFPNPVVGNRLTVQSKTPVKGISLYNSNGLLQQKTLDKSIYIHNMERGVYLLKIETNQTSILKKIVR